MSPKILALYLPQYFPFRENDEWWGKGFTEWTNVGKAKPLWRGHYQPKVPADLGYYDLRVPEVREQQAKLAREAGVTGFLYWHYWFGNNKRLLERPFQEVLNSGKPDFPFCLAWANHDWTTKTWKNNGKPAMIAKQLYPGEEDYRQHFHTVLPAFKDHRYITVDGKPLFAIFDPYSFKDIRNFIEVWRNLAKENGLKGIHFIAICNNTSTMKRLADGSIKRVLPNTNSSAEVYKEMLSLGFDGLNSFGKSRGEMLALGRIRRTVRFLLQKNISWFPPLKYDYAKVTKHFFSPEDRWDNVYPTIMPQWDRTPRAGKHEGIYINSTPENFKKHIEEALEVINDKPNEHKILFLRSWNEWGEGNYVEPDLKYGHKFLEAIKTSVF